MSEETKILPNYSDLFKALSKAQGEMTGAALSAKNPFFNSDYATLASVWDTIRKPLTDNGLAVIQLIHPDDTCVVVETILGHETGQSISSVIRLRPTKADPQGFGSAMTYARRYALMAIVGIAPADDKTDDDGNNASDKSKYDVVAPFIKELKECKTPEQLKAIAAKMKAGNFSYEDHNKLKTEYLLIESKLASKKSVSPGNPVDEDMFKEMAASIYATKTRDDLVKLWGGMKPVAAKSLQKEHNDKLLSYVEEQGNKLKEITNGN